MYVTHTRPTESIVSPPSRASAVRVIVPSTGGDPDDAIWDSTLEELHMYPRAVVFASIYTTKEKEALLEKNHAREAAIERGKAVKIRSEKKYDNLPRLCMRSTIRS